MAGVVDAVKQKRLTERDGLGMLYYAMREDGVPFPVPMRMATIVRAAQSPEALVPELRRALAEIDPTLALDDVKPMTTRVQETLTLPRAMMLLGGVFAAVAGRLDFIDFSDAKLSRGIVGPKADHPRSSTKVLNPPPRIVQRFIVAWLMRILRETIQQIAHLTLVPLLKRKQIGQRLPGKDGLKWRKLSHGAAWKDRSIASSFRRPSPSSTAMSPYVRQATRASAAVDTPPPCDAPLRSAGQAFASNPTSRWLSWVPT